MSKQSIIPKEASQISWDLADCGQKEIGQDLKEIHLRVRIGMEIRKQEPTSDAKISPGNEYFSFH